LETTAFFIILMVLNTKTKNSKLIKILNEKFNGDVGLLLDDLERFAIENREQYEVADKILKLKNKWRK